MSQEMRVLTIIGFITVICIVFGIVFLSRTAPSQEKGDLLVNSSSNKLYQQDKKVTIVEFGDYQCPACASASPVINSILKQYPDKVNFVFRHFPLPQHQNALIASEVAEAAGEQGKYWQMHDILYSKQSEWATSTDPLNIFIGYAATLNLNKDQFVGAVQSNKYQDKIQSDKKNGEDLHINSTPTFYVNGIKTKGYSFVEIKTLVDQELNK